MKRAGFTPKQYSTVCPYLMVHDVNVQIDFLVQIFNAAEKERVRNAEGKVIHGQVAIGEVVIMMGASRPEWPAKPSHIYVFVEDVDKTYRRAINAGARSVIPPGERDYGFIEAGFTDQEDNHWWIASSME